MVDEPWSPRRRRLFGALAAVYALIGGLIFVALLLTGPLWGAFAIGVAVTLALALVTGLHSKFPGALGITLAYSFAFALFIWPVLWLFLGGALWGKWQ